MELTLGGVAAKEPTVERLSLVLWAPAGWGKTTLACSLPGKKALINFDPDGPQSIAGRDDITVFDLSGEGHNLVKKMEDKSDPLGFSKIVEHFDSFVVDSMSTITERTLAYGIAETKGATLIRPSPGAYGARNNVALHLVRTLLQITAQHKKHICFIAHEGPPEKNDEGVLLGYEMALGGTLPSGVSLRVGEVWPMYENGKNQKMVLARSAKMRKAKSKMFLTSPSEVEFEWKYDVTKPWDHPDQMTLARFYEDWKANGFQKMKLPK